MSVCYWCESLLSPSVLQPSPMPLSTMFRTVWVASLASLTFVGAAYSQPIKPSVVITSASGNVVEVIGLRRWTVQMIQDSLDRYSPGDSITKHNCAVVMRYKLGFADASAITFTGYNTGTRMVLVVREPQDSGLVQYRDLPLDSTPVHPRWGTAVQQLRRVPMTLNWIARRWQGDSLSYVDAAQRRQTDSIIQALRPFVTEADRVEALRVLQTDRNMESRAVAALLLIPHLQRDDSWHALLETARESDGWAKGAAFSVLRSQESRASPVNWTPVAPTLRMLLNGSANAFEYAAILNRTGVQPSDAPMLLAGGGEMLIAFGTSQTPMLAQESRRLLMTLRGEDLGDAPAAWQEWVATLRR